MYMACVPARTCKGFLRNGDVELEVRDDVRPVEWCEHGRDLRLRVIDRPQVRHVLGVIVGGVTVPARKIR